MITVSTTLPAEARKLREDVFIHEQGFENEFDEIDQSAHHVIYWESDRAVGTCRFFPAEEDGAYYIGRMAVAKAHRHQQLGTVILEAAEAAIKKLGGKKIMLSAQVRAQNFYLRNGYTGDPEEVHMDEGEPHRWLYKKI